jgi:hypothetical protein
MAADYRSDAPAEDSPKFIADHELAVDGGA